MRKIRFSEIKSLAQSHKTIWRQKSFNSKVSFKSWFFCTKFSSLEKEEEKKKAEKKMTSETKKKGK